MIYLLQHTVQNSAIRFPDREAFRCGQSSLTFRELEEQMNQLANTLHDLKIQKGDRVGIFLNRSIETAIAIYGILQAGAIYVPLNPKAPAERNRFVIQNCGIEILITNVSQKRNVQNLVSEKTNLKTIIGFEEDWAIPTISWETIKKQSSIFHCPFQMMENDLAYILYTSGSTGTPKGIMHTHSSGLGFARLMADLYQMNEEDRVGNHAPIYFDISTLGYFASPLVGACTVIATDAHTMFPTSLSQLIEQEKLTIWYSVPLAMIQMLQNGLLEERNMSTLRWVLYAGEPFPPKHLRRLMNLWKETRFSNVYGPTETNVCTYFHLPNLPETDNPIPIGKVWGNTVSLLLDENDNLAEQGAVGELLIRSVTMMEGYWQNSVLTQQSFYKKINSSGLEEIYYRTGDLAKEDENGILHLLGRKDNQIKTRGYRVELDAVEVKLVAHDSILEAAVFAVPKEDDVIAIEAAVIFKENKTVTEAELKDFLKQKLPFYAIPERIFIMEEFPRTGTGKINRKEIKTLVQ